MITSEAFEKAYKNLNKQQKKAVDTTEGPVMVIAGPGTGKTEILALRIANILLKTDTKPENILALTFTDAGAHAMRERLRRYIGDASYKVAVNTFHSFAGSLIRQYPDAYPSIIGGRPSNDIDKLSIIQNIIDSGQFPSLRPHGDPLYYVKKIPSAINELKKEYITPDIFSERISELQKILDDEPKFHEKGAHKGKVRGAYADMEKRITKLTELCQVYRQYQTVLREQKLFDFEDMIIETVSALQNNEDMLRDIQETYQYILADEHQDVNSSQNQILETLASYHDSPNLFVVGDEKQAIYRFQGASLDNFLFFEDHYKDTEVVGLTENYRSGQAILDAAHSLIKSDDEEISRLRIPLNSAREESNIKPSFRYFAHEAVENDWLVVEINKQIENKVPLNEIAVIVRRNIDVEGIASLLRRHNIDVNPSADSDILEHPITKAVESLLSATCSFTEESLFEVLIGGWLKASGNDIALVLSARNRYWPIFRLINNREKLEEIGVSDIDSILQIGDLLNEARKKTTATSPHLVLQFLIEKSGLLDHVMTHEPIEGTRILRRLYDEVENLVVTNGKATTLDVARELQYRRLHNLALIAPFINNDRSAVQVMTAHKSKGLEFETVFIPRASDDAFGKASKRDLFKLPLMSHEPISAFGPEDDDRRLFYVAMTRAKKSLYISSSENDPSGKLKEPSRFINDIETDLLEVISTEKEGNDFDPSNILKKPLPTIKIDSELIRSIFLSRGLSVTHLNNYIEDPMKYYFANLLRKPQPRSLSLLKGEAVHEVLEKVVGLYIRENTKPNEKVISEYLHNALEKLPLSQSDEVSLHEKSFPALVTYINYIIEGINEQSRTEQAVHVTLETGDVDLPEIPLTGKIDRLDFNKEGQVIKVVDYKTGKPKSRNDIEGLTKSSSGAYKRQLVFYALLLKLQNPEMSESPNFTLSFVEPKERSGEVVEHSFIVTDEEIEELKKVIIHVSKEIISGEKFVV